MWPREIWLFIRLASGFAPRGSVRALRLEGQAMAQAWAPFHRLSPAVAEVVSSIRPTPGGVALPLSDEACRQALAQGLGPLIGGLVVRGRVAMPERLAAPLIREHRQCLAAQGFVDSALESLAGALANLGVPFLGLKGAALARTVYEPGARGMSDVDVLVPPSRWRDALDRLLARGFREADLGRRHFAHAHAYARLVHSPEGVPIEVHRYLCERPLFAVEYEGPDGIFAHAREVRGLRVPSEVDLLVSLAIHAGKHGLALPLRSFVDGVRLLERAPGIESEVLARAARWRALRATQAFLSVVRSLGDQSRMDDDPVSSRWRDRWLALERITRPGSRMERASRLALLVDRPQMWLRYAGARAGLAALDATVQRLL